MHPRVRRMLTKPPVASLVIGSPRRTPIGKEEREGLILREVKIQYPGFPAGGVRRGEDRKGKGPDFVVEGPWGRTVAIELTELYLDNEGNAGEGSPRREQEGLREAFLQRAEDTFYERTFPGSAANVSFSWLPQDLGAAELTPRRVRELAPATAALVARRLVGSAGALVEVSGDELSAAGLGNILWSIWARETRPFLDGRASPWCSSGPSFSPATLLAARIERAIARKETKLEAYQARCTETWLLMAAMGGPSSFDGVDDAVLRHRFRSAFDRVVLLCPGAAPDRRILTLVGP